MTQAYPLTWPEKWQRNSERKPGAFKTGLSTAVNNVLAELRLFGKDTRLEVTDPIISSNVSLTDQMPADPGIAVYFQWDGKDACIAVDIYRTPAANLQAIALIVGAERTKMRHGGLNVVRASFRGYAALPPPKRNNAIAKPWWQVLKVPGDANLEAAEAAYKRLAKTAHPNAGGDRAAWDELETAYRQAKEALGGASR